MTDSLPQARRGRPKDGAKRDAIAATATALFSELSFEEVTMELVAARAGVSKVTVYGHFGDKETLFETVMVAVSDRIMSEAAWTRGDDLPLSQRLTEIGIAFLTTILGPYGRMMVRTLSVALRGNASLASRFYDAGPGRTRAALANAIAEAMEKGLLAPGSATLAAEDLTSLWEGSLMVRVSFGLAEPVSRAEIERRAAHGTAVFLRAYRPSDDRSNATPALSPN
jgi:TetR/AcrR family transcriptional repressor of mexJK operon